ncbi:hypothetical protein Dimus_006310, partial [Dionaea muscipula]
MSERTGGCWWRGDVMECSRRRWSIVGVAKHARLGGGVATSPSLPVVVARSSDDDVRVALGKAVVVGRVVSLRLWWIFGGRCGVGLRGE